MKIISKAEAIKQGLKTYYTGKLCPRGHDAPRFVTGKCIECNRERNKLRPKTGKTTKSKAVTVVAAPNKDWRYYVAEIEAAWQSAVQGIIATGALLNEGKSKVDHGDWLKLVQELPFGERTAQMLMAIAANPVLSDANHGSDLPPSWRTLYELTRVPDDVLLARIEDHTINAGMERRDVAALTGARHPQTMLRRRSKADERIVAQREEIKSLTAHITELEAARESGVYIDTEADDDAALAGRILGWIGKERVSGLIAELQKLIRAEAT
jgi:hypothetical protein